MATSRGAATRRTEVSPERLVGWLERYVTGHGEVTVDAGPETVGLRAADGSQVQLSVPFPPLSQPSTAGLVEHALRSRRVGVLLVRLGGHAVGVFDGETLTTSKVGSRQVHGRSSAGGWSQQRFARRREGQVRVALAAAADVAVRILVPAAASLDALVVGGDRRAVDAVLEDPRLATVRRLVVPPLHDVPDPRLTVLRVMPARFRAVRIEVHDAPAAD